MGATAENDTSIFKFGNQSIKLNATGGNETRITKAVSLNFSSGDGISFWYYTTDKTKLSYVILDISSTTNYAKYFKRELYLLYLQNGWNYIVLSKSNFTNVGSESWDNTMVRIRFRVIPKTGEDASANFDDLRFGIVGQPKVIITFDDDCGSQINKAYPIMTGNGQAGVAFIYTNGVGSGASMTLANLITLRDAGWDISNHTAAHKSLTAVSQEEMEADIDGGYDWLVANGFGDTAKFFAYPGGNWNDAVITKLKQRHVLARAIITSDFGMHFAITNFEDLQYKLRGYGLSSTIGVAAVQTVIDSTIAKSGLLILYFHRIVDSNATGNDYLTADFQAISDYLKTKQDAGLLEVITYSDYYNALIGLEPFCLEKPAMDFNDDCKVDFKDLALFSQSWLECNLEPKSACWE
jgi:peptidoglycan/xylan/chitin deacetylase (PgdA/CDA1 family)